MHITRSYKPLCSHRFVSEDGKRDDNTAEIATNEVWRGIMVRARKTHKLTQVELGKLVGLSQVMISKIETGESGGSSEILQICKQLKIQPPQHFADDWQKKWAELGQLLRHKSPEQAEAALRLVESMAAPLGTAVAVSVQANSPDSDPSDRRK